MRIILATLDSSISDNICTSLKEKFKVSNIEIIENYEELGKYLDDKTNLFFIDNNLKFQGIPTQVLQKFTKTNKFFIKNSASRFILLSKDKKAFHGLAHFDSNVETLQFGKSQQNNNYKIEMLVNNLSKQANNLRAFLKEKQKIYFIHGFSGNQDTWNKLIKLIKEDIDCKDFFEVDYYNYPTFTFSPLKLFKILVPRKYDNLYDNAKSLNTKIKNDNSDNFIIIGHSLGGLIIREFLVNFYLNDYKKKLKKVLLYAPAHNGSLLATYLSKIYRRNIHLKTLVNKNDILVELNERWKKSKIEDKLYIKAIIGLRDKTVKKDSAIYGFKERNIDTFCDKNHLNIKNPGNKESQIFKNFKRHILQ